MAIIFKTDEVQAPDGPRRVVLATTSSGYATFIESRANESKEWGRYFGRHFAFPVPMIECASGVLARRAWSAARADYFRRADELKLLGGL